MSAAAPSKPPLGRACNGCGVCCAAEPCAAGLLLLWQRRGACRALEWEPDGNRYRCGLLSKPRRHLRWLPAAWEGAVRRLAARWIAAGRGCDSDAEVYPVRHD